MRVTIIPEDKWIRRDDTSAKLPEWNFDDSNIHAIQWYEDHGEIEWKNPQRNESITDDSILQPYLNALDQYLITLIPSSDNTTLSNILKFEQQLHKTLNNSLFSVPFKKAITKGVYKREFNFLIKIALLTTNNVINKPVSQLINIIKYFETIFNRYYHYNLKFSEVVGDFIHSNDDHWYFIQIKSLKISDLILSIKSIISNTKSACGFFIIKKGLINVNNNLTSFVLFIVNSNIPSFLSLI